MLRQFQGRVFSGEQQMFIEFNISNQDNIVQLWITKGSKTLCMVEIRDNPDTMHFKFNGCYSNRCISYLLNDAKFVHNLLNVGVNGQKKIDRSLKALECVSVFKEIH